MSLSIEEELVFSLILSIITLGSAGAIRSNFFRIQSSIRCYS